MLTVTKMDVWSAAIEDRPGSLSEKLEGLAIAGADLDFIVSRRMHEEPGKAIVFITPLSNDKQVTAAKRLGFRPSDSLHTLCVRGPDEPGIANRVARAVAAEKINIHGVSAAQAGNEFVMFLSFENATDAERARNRLALSI